MSAFDDLWSKGALTELAALSESGKRQTEALVRDVCDAPASYPDAPGRPRTQAARSGAITVLFQVDVLDRLVYVVGVSERG